MLIRFVSSGNSRVGHGPSVFVFCTAAAREGLGASERTNLLFMPIYIMRLKTKLYASPPPGARICAETFPENFQRSSLNLWKIIYVEKCFQLSKESLTRLYSEEIGFLYRQKKEKNRLSGRIRYLPVSQPARKVHIAWLGSKFFFLNMKRTVSWIGLND